jgi:PmbA protein
VVKEGQMNKNNFFEKSIFEKKINNLEDISKSIFLKLNNKNLQGCELIFNGSRSFSLSSFNKKISKYNISDTLTCGIRIHNKSNKIGIAFTERIDEQGINYLVDSAFSNLNIVESDNYQEITNKDLSSELINDTNFSNNNPTIDDQINLAKKLEQEILNKGNNVQSSPYNNYSQIVSYDLLMNDKGLINKNLNRYFTCHTSALLKEDTKNSTFYNGTVNLDFEKLDSNYCINTAYSIANQMLHAEKPKTDKYNVIFDINALRSLFSAFSSSFSGQYAMDGLSKFKNSINNEVSHKELSIFDDPFNNNSLLPSKVDDEGTARKLLPIIEKGLLKSLLHNTKTANFFNTKTTGHASRSPKTVLGVSPTNILIPAGSNKFSELKNETYIEIIHFAGIHAGTNTISGDFSLMSSGYYHHNGKKTPIKEFTISGNFYELLQKISFIGDELMISDYKTIFAPKIVFNDLSISS